jgi:predicted glycosyl hydrolase (DUF1957 family)
MFIFCYECENIQDSPNGFFCPECRYETPNEDIEDEQYVDLDEHEIRILLTTKEAE